MPDIININPDGNAENNYLKKPWAPETQPIQHQAPFQIHPQDPDKNALQKAIENIKPPEPTIGVPVTPAEWEYISSAAASAKNPEEELQKFATAITFSNEYGIDVSSAYQNLEELTQYQIGQNYQPTISNTKAIWNSIKMGKLTYKRGMLQQEFMNTHLKGLDTSDVDARIAEIDSQMIPLEDNTPRGLLTRVYQWAGQTAPYSFNIAAEGFKFGTFSALTLAALIAVTGGAAALPLAAGAVTLSGAFTAGSATGVFKKGFEMEKAATYYEMVKNGVDRQTADYVSLLPAFVTGITEAAFDQIGGTLLTAMGGKSFVGSIASQISSKLAVSGKLGALVSGITRWVAEGAGEGVQELIQSFSSEISKELGYAISEVESPNRYMPIIEQAVQEGVQGFAVGLVFGGVSAGVTVAKDAATDVYANVKQAEAIRKIAAEVPSKEAFVKGIEVARPANRTQADWADSMATVWERAHAKDEQISPSAIESESAAVNELDAGEGAAPTARIRRLTNGSLHTAESNTVTIDTDGVEHHTLLVGDPISGRRYGSIEYSIKDNNITIDNVLVRSGFESIRSEAVIDLMRQYQGYDITWEAKGENLQSIKDEIIAANPRGAEVGLQYFDGLTNVDERLELEATIGKAMPNLNASERAVAATIIQLRAEAKGMAVNAYMEQYGKDGELYRNATGQGVDIGAAKGAVSFSEVEGDVKAIIYAGEKGDFSTFAHESFHLFRREMEQVQQLQEALTEAAKTTEFKQFINQHKDIFSGTQFEGMDAFDVAQELESWSEDGTWTRKQEEIAARLWEAYLLDGQTSSTKLKNIFRRIAEWMSKIYSVLKKRVQLDKRITDVFDSMLDSDSPIAQAAKRDQTRESTRESGESDQETDQVAQEETGQADTDILFQGKSEYRKQYDAVVAQYQDTDQWLKAPNGEPTNLTEQQWVTVRTPAFKEWFGDWENDPENASKVIDENGEPLVVYHGTDEEFTEFKDTGRYDNLGFYFTDDINIADSYTEYLGAKDFYLSIKNPYVVDAKGRGWREIGRPEEGSAEDYDYVLTGYKDGKFYEEFLDFDVDWETRAEELGLEDAEAILGEDYETKTTRDLAWDAKYKGYDGVIVKDVVDLGGHGGGGVSTVYIVFSPTQIKSATGNTGAFDSGNPSILLQENGNPILKTGFPKRPDLAQMLDDATEKKGELLDSKELDYIFNNSIKLNEQWKKDLKQWLDNAGDMLQFGDEEVIELVHQNVRPNEKPWRSTTFRKWDGEWIPMGHVAFDSKYEAVKSVIGLKEYNPSILFQQETTPLSLEDRVGGDELLDTLEMIEEIKSVGAQVNDRGIVTVYHATSKDAAVKIEKTGYMRASEDALFFSTKSDGQISGYGESIVKLEVPAEKLFIDDIFSDEARLIIELGRMRGRSIREFSPSILFQEEIDKNILENARQFDTWEEFRDSYVIDAGFDFTVELPSDDAWYQETFNRAHNIDDTKTLGEEPVTGRARLESEQQKDDYFNDLVESDEEIEKFIKEIGNVLTFNPDTYIPTNEEEAAEVETKLDLQVRIPVEVHPTITANAYRSRTTKNITQRSIKAIRTIITGEGTRFYRDIYADLMNDKELKPEVTDERLPRIDEPGYDELGTMSITERLRLADSMEASELKNRILSGEETMDGDAEKVIKQMDRDIAKLENEIKKSEEELEETETKLSSKDYEVSQLYKKMQEGKTELNSLMRRIRKNADADPKYQVSKKDYNRQYSLEAKIDALNEQIKKLRVSDKVKATVKRQEALGELKNEMRAKQKERDDARKLREFKQAKARRIMVKPSAAIDWEYAEKIYKIQAMLDPKFRQSSVVIFDEQGDEQRVKIEEAKQILEASSDEEIREALGDRLFERIRETKKPLNDWTINELEKMEEDVANLREEGRRVLDAKNEQKRAIAESYQQAIMRSLMKSGKYRSKPITGSREDLEQRRHPREVFRSIWYATRNMERMAKMIDGGIEGEAYSLLIRQRRRLQDIERKNKSRRMKPIFEVMEKHDISIKNLYKTVTLMIDGKEVNFTMSNLGYIYLSQFNEDNKAAISYGNLVSTREKERLYNDNELIRSKGDRRYQQLLGQVEEVLSQNEGIVEVVKAIREDFAGQKERINEVAIREYNEKMRDVEEYLPIHRRDISGEDLAANIADDWFNRNAGGVATSVEKGFTTSRINISPAFQGAVDIDLFNVWNTSTTQQEHMIAFAEYVRKLNRVFKNAGARPVKDMINQTYGHAMLKDIEEYINEIANPSAFNVVHGGVNKFVKFARGNLGAAYLAWKTSGLVLQLITSPMPFLSDVNVPQLLRAYKDITAHPLRVWDFITSKSTMMEERSANVIIDQILKESQTYTDNKWKRFNQKQQEIGTYGYIMVDRWSVAGGWLAAYRQKLEQLVNEGIDSDIADTQASEYADDVVLRTQPTGDSLELAPLFKSGGELAKVFTQFQASLNVIWNNITYDVPHMIKNSRNKELPDVVRKQELKRAIGQITGYVIAGAVLGMVADGFDGDDDNEEKLADLVYWSTTQFTASVPLVGKYADALSESLITGDDPYLFQDNIMPAFSSLAEGAIEFSQQDYDRALRNLSDGFAKFVGLPASGVKEVFEAFGDSGPGAFLGRRDYK